MPFPLPPSILAAWERAAEAKAAADAALKVKRDLEVANAEVVAKLDMAAIELDEKTHTLDSSRISLEAALDSFLTPGGALDVPPPEGSVSPNGQRTTRRAG